MTCYAGKESMLRSCSSERHFIDLPVLSSSVYVYGLLDSSSPKCS